MAPRTMKTNPAFLTEQELVDSFVVRHADLQLVMQAVRENTGPSNQHVLITGPRGIGKTTLVLRVVAEIRRDPELNRHWYPIVFAEESYQVSTPGEFWLEAIFHLARQMDSQEWRAVHTDLLNEGDEDRLRERALAQLMDFADAQRKRILLVVENLPRNAMGKITKPEIKKRFLHRS
ncbi:ATP-binding protein [candidate division KSB1 bacterium]|nr:ATP-binding protein [candidate division KSB1 bacterium]